MTRPLLLLELNEVNFEHIQFYCARGLLPHFDQLIRTHTLCETTSETSYEELEPWIQWVTAHTGMTLAEHQVFRLGDIVKHDHPQVWEILEAAGLSVGAISPMNAKNRLQKPAFFVPDPWTPTEISAPRALVSLYEAIRQAVSDNAQAKLSPAGALRLMLGVLKYASPANYTRYARLLGACPTKPWCKAILLDLLLSDVFVSEVRRTRPHFASLFVNAAAHIQHHYMFSSRAYQGDERNPSWYVKANSDPVYDVYRIYDRILAMVRTAFPSARLMIATGLHQDPHGSVTYYWRLRDHARFLDKIGVKFESVHPLMSRDFAIKCGSETAALEAAQVLCSASGADGTPLFEVDNRGDDLFVMLTYPRNVPDCFGYRVSDRVFENFNQDIAFVAIKNGEHNGIGYFIDTGNSPGAGQFRLADVPRRIFDAFGITDPQRVNVSALVTQSPLSV